MEVTFDEPKRLWTLKNRGLDFRDAGAVFDGEHFSIEDERKDYGEPLFQTIGRLGEEIVMVVWTPRSGSRRIISMRLCDAKERQFYQHAVERP